MLMYIRNSLAATVYRMLVAVLASLGLWMCFDSFGLTAWRILLTYVLLGTALYFGLLAIIGFITKEQRKQIVGSPMLEGALIIGLLTTSITTFVFMAQNWSHPALTGGAAALSYVTLPVLVIADWLIFLPKGRWQGIYPFYWLAFPTIYAALILLTAELWPKVDLRYPLGFLDYQFYDIVRMIWVLIFYAVCVLIGGYGFYIIDALMSGKVGKHIVLPKIKLVEIEDKAEEIEEVPEKTRQEKRRPKAPQPTKK